MLQRVFAADLDPARLAGRAGRAPSAAERADEDRDRLPVLLGRARAACSSTSGTWPRR